MARNSRQTGPKAASAAGKTLRDPKATQAERSAAASALAQAPNSTGQSGAKAASAASKTLKSPRATQAERSAAASTLSQTPSRRGKK